MITPELEERIAREVIFLAERMDVTEELVRLAAHIAQFRQHLASSDKAVGRTLEFLTQEMHARDQHAGIKVHGHGHFFLCRDGERANGKSAGTNTKYRIRWRRNYSATCTGIGLCLERSCGDREDHACAHADKRIRLCGGEHLLHDAAAPL